jgi:hypothetical protein
VSVRDCGYQVSFSFQQSIIFSFQQSIIVVPAKVGTPRGRGCESGSMDSDFRRNGASYGSISHYSGNPFFSLGAALLTVAIEVLMADTAYLA